MLFHKHSRMSKLPHVLRVAATLPCYTGSHYRRISIDSHFNVVALIRFVLVFTTLPLSQRLGSVFDRAAPICQNVIVSPNPVECRGVALPMGFINLAHQLLYFLLRVV